MAHNRATMRTPFVLCINPWIYDFTAYDLWTKPLGLLYIAAFLRQRGVRVEVIDCLDKWQPELLNQGASRGLSFFKPREFRQALFAALDRFRDDQSPMTS